MKNIIERSSSVFGVGVNDADYRLYKHEKSGNKYKIVWRCPYYRVWSNMLKRCYYQPTHVDQPTYRECVVCEEWLVFSNFKAWMETQDWEGMQLDKDILFVGNNIYSPKTCVFVTQQVNLFLVDSRKTRGEYLIGVSWHKESRKFKSQCRNPLTSKQEHIGLFLHELEAHKAWLKRKLEHAYALAKIQADPRVAKALIERYTNYKLQVGNNG